jgi:isoleucyl-tRNA synthetase
MAALLALRTRVNEKIEPLRAAGQLGKSLDAAVTIAIAPGDPLEPVLQERNQFLPEWFIVSHVALAPADPKSDSTTISVRPAQEINPCRCPRCWRWVPALKASPHGDVCSRCVEALRS